jgi:iron complex transport system substrate-binding protein
MLFALGLGESVVAVTHECDYPPEARRRARLTRSVIPGGLTAGEIDAAVRDVTSQGRALYELDEPALAALDVDLIVTQALCAVCAVSYDDVRAVADRLPTRPRVISLDPETLDEVLGDVTRLGEATEAPRAAAALRAGLEERIVRVREAVTGADRPRVVALEWLDPPFAGGHWVPEMIELAGGVDPLGKRGEKSRTISWEEAAAARPDVAVLMPCGLYADEALEQAAGHRDELEAMGARQIFAVDAASSFSRPGPRLADGTELLAHLLHPDRVPAPADLAWRPVAAAPVG